MSHTSSTYTYTTCRILHPSDQLLSVTPSPVLASGLTSYAGTPALAASPVPFSAPPTPSYTPCCTPRRLSLSHSLTESSTNLRDSTKTTSTSLGLVRLLQECGISASVYDPCSWDRGLDASEASAIMGGVPSQTCTNTPEQSHLGRFSKRPDSLLLQPSTPPGSPRSKSASSVTTRPVFQFSPTSDDPPYYDAFLASKPARVILREVLGEAERERGEESDDDGQTEISNLRLVDKLKRFRTLSPFTAPVSNGNALLAPLVSSGQGSALGGGLPCLNAGLRRNRSYPAMVGASMAMKDPGGPPSSEILIPHTMQTSHTQQAINTQETGKLQTNNVLVTKTIHMPQTLHALETITPHTIVQRHTRPKDEWQDSARHNDEENGT